MQTKIYYIENHTCDVSHKKFGWYYHYIAQIRSVEKWKYGVLLCKLIVVNRILA